MRTVHERNFPRHRAAVAYLESTGSSTRKEDVFEHAERLFPPVADDLDTVSSGDARWLNDLLWQTTWTAKAGWITKDGRGNWRITDAGREALARFEDPTAFTRECERLFNEWNQARKAQQRRAWLVRGSSVLGANVVGEWLAGEWVSLPASQLRPIEAGITAEELAAAAREDYDHLKHSELKSKVDEILAFVTKMGPGDVVLTTSEQRVYVGDVTGEWAWQASEGGRSNLRRPVEWRNVDAPIDFADLPAPLPAKLASGANVVDLTADLEVVDNLTSLDADTQTGAFAEALGANGPLIAEQDPSDEGPESLPPHEHLRQPSVALAVELFVESRWLDRVRNLLDERRQLIFYGPPGTGKTYLARKLAADLVGPEQVKLVQFHPAFTYEDFFEGYRPAPGSGGTIGFELRPGPLRQLVSRAIEHRDQAFVLIIDEINRANLAKVFGELYFLLEYRDQAVDLLYSSGDEPFTLPPNLYLIGTMNTADRSIALVDSAMRRRFAFVALDPAAEPTALLLRRWSAHHQLPATAADLLDELNRRIDDPDFRVGPSYFMRQAAPGAFNPDRLEVIWDSDIEPLLEEHYYGQWASIAARFSLAALLKVLPGATGNEPETVDADLTAETSDESVLSPPEASPFGQS
ncbi:MAG TPA: AAA family ATPase [Acidimicrobiales bacterium]|nr:AAA family ATPase [Acidimicrobiales bacterium]